jgi:hypothetical protein
MSFSTIQREGKVFAFGGKRREADSASGMSKITSCLGSKSGNEKEEK